MISHELTGPVLVLHQHSTQVSTCITARSIGIPGGVLGLEKDTIKLKCRTRKSVKEGPELTREERTSSCNRSSKLEAAFFYEYRGIARFVDIVMSTKTVPGLERNAWVTYCDMPSSAYQ